MNKKLVKRVAVASLAALMSIPNLAIPGNNTSTVYAIDTTNYDSHISMAEYRLGRYEELLKTYESRGNTKMIEKTKQRIEQTKQELAEAQAGKANQAQEQKQIAAAQAEKDRIANTVYPLHARYVKDFVPAVDDHKPHYYERPDLPGVIFTLRQNEFGDISDVKPHIKVKREAPDWIFLSSPADDKTKKFQVTMQQFVVSYTSPFNFCGCPTMQSTAYIEPNQLYVDGGFPHHIGENIEYQISREINQVYYEGWPAEYIGKTVGAMPGHESVAFNNGKPYDRYTVQEMQDWIDSVSGFTFSLKEKLTHSSYVKYNKEHGGAWINEKDIYQIAQEFGTDYTDEERPLYDIRKKQSELPPEQRRLTLPAPGGETKIRITADPITGKEISREEYIDDGSYMNR